ncbi:alpha/beta fold hydrolase [Streptomyces longwoodensis]|uniref:Thioesterase n=1 Tax=Streptomyces lasalocidi TaxID=324833 RepID=B5M9K2_STRLS|nr:alpha/beta fold hydrolase [Streptomyces longwoodensis]WUC61896.1 alpha/beta fold hydrolase [Streptomyces longwoodensis]CAQ64680.1 thioesterase [Streptomyces lasalocidi]
MSTSVGSGTWIRQYRTAGPGAPRLVCFPHAGGSASFYFPVATALSPDVDVLAVQYPGRQDRMGEQPLTDLRRLADQVAEALEPWRDQPLHLFGHSMGAVIAYEVALRLQQSPGPGPAALYVSGRRAPSTRRTETVHLRDDAGLIRELKTLAGTDAALLADDDVLAMILPALRADYRAIETYEHRPAPLLTCPVTALLGDADPKVTLAEAEVWREHTDEDFDLHVFPGGHFYLTTHQPAVLTLLRERLKA